ncbi:MAG: trehalose-phosphatase, partial [Jatrophihabitans sp.]|nr:trehalose-phosphatase [Jatrophihabitans sp.]
PTPSPCGSGQSKSSPCQDDAVRPQSVAFDQPVLDAGDLEGLPVARRDHDPRELPVDGPLALGPLRTWAKIEGMDVAELVESVRPVLDGALIATDFDGTLAPLVPDPQDSRPVAGALDALTALTERGARVAVITGRDAGTVVRLGGLDSVAGLTVAGLYGLETWTAGKLTSPAEPDAIGELRARLPALLADAHADPKVWIEDKGLSLVVHARKADDPDAALATLSEPLSTLARELDLEVHPGAHVLELRLPGFDKGGALAQLVTAYPPRSVVYFGDDLGDLPAFAEIGLRRAAGAVAWSVGELS